MTESERSRTVPEALKRSKDAQYQQDKANSIRAKHPEVSKLEGPYPPSVLYLLVLLAVHHVVIAAAATYLPILGLMLVCWMWSCTGYYAISTFVHENSHGLVLPGKNGQALVTFLFDLGLTTFGGSVEYQYLHSAQHHMFLNDSSRDNECHAHVEPIKSLPLRCLSYFTELLPLGPLVIRPLLHAKDAGKSFSDVSLQELMNIYPSAETETKHSPPLPSHMKMAETCSIVASVLALILQLVCVGRWAVVAQLWSLSFYLSQYSTGFRGQDMAEHPLQVVGGKATLSTYFLWENFWGLNTGYHSEHHSFPRIPWIHLPKVKKMAPELFDENHTHYHVLLWRWLCTGCDVALYKPCDKLEKLAAASSTEAKSTVLGG